MIQTRQRSITRFFIPLLDIMMLLFSMFLLMPMVQNNGTGDKSPDQMGKDELIAKNDLLDKQMNEQREQIKQQNVLIAGLRKYEQVQTSFEKLKKDIEELQRAKLDVLKQRLFIQVMTFDPKKKNLIYHELGPTPKMIVINNPQTAGQLIEQHQLQAKQADKELYYLMLLPLDKLPQYQISNIEMWFKDVPFQLLATPS